MQVVDGATTKRDKILRTIRSLHESPGAKEAAILREQEIAKTDPEIRAFVDQLFFDADRAASLERYLASGFAQDVIAAIRHHYGARKDMAICEIGAGNGFLAASLVRAGYTNVDILEPTSEHHTGTGFLQTVEEFSRIEIFNDLDAWYSDPKVYDLIITNACIHHFENPVVAASQIRLKVKDGALWLAFVEFFGFGFEDVLSQLNRHRHAVLYQLYEWPYSANLYAAMLRAAGFNRIAVSAALPYGSRPLSPVFRAWRAVWRLILALRVSGLAFSSFVLLVKLLRPDWLWKAGALYMAFHARPIRWGRVATGYAT